MILSSMAKTQAVAYVEDNFVDDYLISLSSYLRCSKTRNMDIKFQNVGQNKGGHTFMVCCEVFVVIMS